MMNKKIILVFGLLSFAIFYISSCKKDPKNNNSYTTTPYNLIVPVGLNALPISADNLLTVEGVALGKKLFYDPILSLNNTQSCASCHNQSYAFTDSNLKFSTGIDGSIGTRNSMPLFNLGYAYTYFWDGRAKTIESQALGPIQNPKEMKNTLNNVITQLNANATYPDLFKKAFGTSVIDTILLAKAIAQFERTLLSGNTKMDNALAKTGVYNFTAQEQSGFDIFMSQSLGDCNHCHSLGTSTASAFTNFDFKNNGLDVIPPDRGRYYVTQNIEDIGKFKTPSLRNLAFTAPYMHDGRFATLTDVIAHYDHGFVNPPNLDVNMAALPKFRLTVQNQKDLIAFLLTATDSSLITNPAFAK